MWQAYLDNIQRGQDKALARAISLIEHAAPGYEQLLRMLPDNRIPIIGITGPPGAGKSTLADALIGEWVNAGKRIGVVCVDPSSPFNLGALLGDRIRMSDWYTHPQVFIRSLATRGSLGGLHPRIIEITDLMRAFPFDLLIVETVGVGQSEIEIAGLADVTAVVLVPEGGDEIQTMKAGLMEIADLFVVNKADRPGAGEYVRNLRQMLAPVFSSSHSEVAILQTIASAKQGIVELAAEIGRIASDPQRIKEKRAWLLAEKAWWLLQQRRMQDIDKEELKAGIAVASEAGDFNLYRFLETR